MPVTSKMIFEIAELELQIERIKAVENIETSVAIAKNALIMTEQKRKREETLPLEFKEVLLKAFTRRRSL